ncbi:hypothetical protein AX16_005601 [Volvariella volvacea WC 439]|nr:hypothetical protein AX16_005601 [Volvariella volvacea WC 439]
MKDSGDEQSSCSQSPPSHTSPGGSRRPLIVVPTDDKRSKHSRSKRKVDITSSPEFPSSSTSRTYHVSLGLPSEQPVSKSSYGGVKKDWSMKTVYSQEHVDPDVAEFVPVC